VNPASIDCVVSHHMNTFASGVARFNQVLAEQLGVPLVGLDDQRLSMAVRPLLSFKMSELSDDERVRLARRLDEGRWQHQLYLHDWSAIELEERLARSATRIFCGNREILEQVGPYNEATELSWTPGLLLDARRFRPAELTVFSFGMAHKLRTDMFRRLRNLLAGTHRSYGLYVSTANHETASIRDAQIVYEEMHEIFPRELYFMGNLSDVAVYNQLQDCTFFAAFFEHGLRSNNTSVAAAMEQGAVVITNLDEHSPAQLHHMVNVIDINQAYDLPLDPLVLRRIGLAAMETAREHTWDRLARQIAEPLPTPTLTPAPKP
jgi:hypothetical protein